jgi:hypothetical protein
VVADAVMTAAMDGERRRELRERGHARLKDFDLQRPATAHRAVYRRAGGFPLTGEDRWLLQGDWVPEPESRTESQ